jgi:hypothetical protein
MVLCQHYVWAYGLVAKMLTANMTILMRRIAEVKHVFERLTLFIHGALGSDRDHCFQCCRIVELVVSKFLKIHVERMVKRQHVHVAQFVEGQEQAVQHLSYDMIEDNFEIL